MYIYSKCSYLFVIESNSLYIMSHTNVLFMVTFEAQNSLQKGFNQSEAKSKSGKRFHSNFDATTKWYKNSYLHLVHRLEKSLLCNISKISFDNSIMKFFVR